MQHSNPVNTKLDISEDSYNRHMASASSLGNYFMFRKCYLRIMSRDAALVIQDVINKMGYLMRKGKLRSDRWVPMTVEKLEKSLAMKKDCQHRVLLELKGVEGKCTGRLPFIEVTKFGRPTKRYVRVNFANLNKALDEAFSQIPEDKQTSRSQDNCEIGSSGNPDDMSFGSSGNPDDAIEENKMLRNNNKFSGTLSASPRGIDGNQKARLPNVDPSSQDKESTSPNPVIIHTEHKYRNQIPTLASTTDPAKIIANALWATLTSKNRLPINAKPKTWVQVIRKSLLSHVDLQTALAALAWYDKHVGGKYIPDIRSARTLVDKWEALQSAIQRERQSTDASTNTNTLMEVKLTKPIRRVLKQLDHLHWPKGSRGQIPAAVADTMTAFSAFRKANSELAASEGHRKYDLRDFAQWLMNEWSDDPEEFAAWWLEELNERVSDWPAWSGIVKGLSIDDKQFHKWLSDQVEEYGEDSRFTQRYLKEIRNGLDRRKD